MVETTLWPVRNVAEYAYCPRLFYMMEVEGLHPANADTVKGLAVHRRVDHPSKSYNSDQVQVQDDNRPAIVRSLVLTSVELGLTGTLDLAEIEGNRAIPVEYRKGRPQRQQRTDSISNEDAKFIVRPWPADKVQIGLQCLLLKHAGYVIDNGVLYYAGEKRRVDVPFDDALQQEALATLEAARICAESPRPPPLVNSPRCPRCSMVSACLPDEINFDTSNDGDTVKPRKIWPPRDDGIHVVLQQNGAKVGVSGNTLRVTDADGGLLNEVPIVNIESLSVIGGVQVTTQAIQHLSEKSIPIAFMTSAGRTVALIDPLDSVSAEIRKAQVHCCDRSGMCLYLTRALVTAKIMNQRTLLLRNNPSISAEHLQQMTGMANLVKTAVSIEEVRGYEGQAANLYFINFADMLKEPFAVEFRKYGRQRRPPPDPVNSCLSMAYTMLTHECVSALRIAGLEPSIGAFHVSKPGRPALALDLMEPFRPLIADSLALTGFNRGEFKPEHFERTAAGCIFSDEGRKAFFNAYGRRMATEVKHPVYGYTLSYRRMIVLHARLIAAWMAGEIKSLVFLTTR